MQNSTTDNTMDNLLELNKRIIKLLNLAPKIIKQFYTNIEDGLVNQLPRPSEKPHIVSTTQGLHVIFECVYLSEISESLDRNKIWKFFKSNKWESAGIPEHNIYVDSQVLVIASKLGKRRGDDDKIDEAIKVIISDLKSLLEAQEFEPIVVSHGFILYWAIRALKEYEYWKDLKEEEITIVTCTLNYIENLFYKQLALGLLDDEEFDPVQLAYYLLTLIQYDIYVRPKVVRKAIDVMVSKQIDGTWKTNPFIQQLDGVARYCMSIEIPIVIARILNQRDDLIDLVGKYEPSIKRTVEWVEEYQRKEETYIGWRSERYSPGPPQSWATALILEFLSTNVIAIGKYIRQLIMKEFGGKVIPTKISWSEIVDYRGFKCSIEKNLIEPIKRGKNKLKGYGIILYGLPGNGKNTVVYALAKELGNWETIKMTPVNFLMNGPNIIPTAQMIFNKLSYLERAIIFLDEIDAIVAPREIPKEFITPATFTACLLNWLPELKNTKIVFIVATNHIKNFEEAVRRYGRFDLVLPVGPPEGDEKKKFVKRLLCEEIDKNLIDENDVEEAVKSMEKRMIIAEILELCKSIKGSTAGGRKISKEELLGIVDRYNKSALTVNQEALEKFENNINEYARGLGGCDV